MTDDPSAQNSRPGFGPVHWFNPRPSAAVVERFQRQYSSGFWGPGKAVRSLEVALEQYLGRSHAICTVSGTVALSLAAKSLGLGRGSRVGIPAYGVISVSNAFRSIGAEVVPVDLDARDGCLSVAAVKNAVEAGNLDALCYVHFGGDIGRGFLEILDLCRSYGTPVIEDAACALGQSVGSVRAGSFGNISTVSLSAHKPVSCGQGGIVLTDEISLALRIRDLIDQGDASWRDLGRSKGIGSNLRMSDLNAVIAEAQFADINESLNHRSRFHHHLQNASGHQMLRGVGIEGPLYNFLLVDSPVEFVTQAKKNGIEVKRPYQRVDETKVFDVASRFENQLVALPFGAGLSVEDQRKVTAFVSGFSSDRR